MTEKKVEKKDWTEIEEAILGIQCSPRFRAVLEWLFEVDVKDRTAELPIHAMVASLAGESALILAQVFGGIGYNTVIGDFRELTQNLISIARVAELPDPEIERVLRVLLARLRLKYTGHEGIFGDVETWTCTTHALRSVDSAGPG